ncbi:MAG: hypothetical protein AAF849_09865 [Bacteroidota bacterium]
MNITVTNNLLPEVLCLSHNKYKSNVTIHPHPSPNPAALQEIVSIKHDRKKQELTIYTKSQSEQRSAFAAAIAKDKVWKVLLEIVEEEWGYVMMEMAKEERANVLGISELQGRFFEIPKHLSEEQQRILAWLLPYSEQIQSDKRLIEDALFTAIGQQVHLREKVIFRELEEGIKVNQWVVGTSTIVSGREEKPSIQLDIETGPVPIEELEDFVQGGKWRSFLEEQLYPAFLPKNWSGETHILVAKEKANFVVNEYARVGINTLSNQD